MRDYVDLSVRLDSLGKEIPLCAEAADAIRELKVIADKMTSLGADLEEQVAEQLQADVFWDCNDEETGYPSLESVLANYSPGEHIRVGRGHTLSDIWAVWLPNADQPFSAYTEEEVLAKLEEDSRIPETT